MDDERLKVEDDEAAKLKSPKKRAVGGTGEDEHILEQKAGRSQWKKARSGGSSATEQEQREVVTSGLAAEDFEG